MSPVLTGLTCVHSGEEGVRSRVVDGRPRVSVYTGGFLHLLKGEGERAG